MNSEGNDILLRRNKVILKSLVMKHTGNKDDSWGEQSPGSKRIGGAVAGERAGKEVYNWGKGKTDEERLVI